MTTDLLLDDAVTPTPEDSELAEVSGRRLAEFLEAELSIRVDDDSEPIVLPASAVRLLVDLLSAMAAGNAVTLIPIHAELTTQQAADLIGVSRPFLIKQMEEGEIPFHKVGTHRRVLFKDLMAYKRRVDAKRIETLDRLTALSQELGLEE